MVNMLLGCLLDILIQQLHLITTMITRIKTVGQYENSRTIID